MQKSLRGHLAQLGVESAERFTLKPFRVGKATAMAAAGETLAAILAAGEWRSSAFLKYISESELDRQRLLEDAIMEDEDAE